MPSVFVHFLIDYNHPFAYLLQEVGSKDEHHNNRRYVCIFHNYTAFTRVLSEKSLSLMCYLY